MDKKYTIVDNFDGIKQRLVGLVWFGVALAFGEEVVVSVVVVFSRVICSEKFSWHLRMYLISRF